MNGCTCTGTTPQRRRTSCIDVHKLAHLMPSSRVLAAWLAARANAWTCDASSKGFLLAAWQWQAREGRRAGREARIPLMSGPLINVHPRAQGSQSV